jgi:GNAT superfamily N-acetyltransferase
MNIDYIEEKPTAKEYLKLRNSAGWNVFPEKAAEEAIKNTFYFITAWMNKEIVGMGRVSGDGKIVFFISDSIVLPEFQRKGIGTKIMIYIMDYVYKNAEHGSLVNLNAVTGMDDFYEKFGFWKRPTDKFGYGMSQFINKK